MAEALVIGSGPAGLMAAEALADSGLAVTVADSKPSFGRKFLMAGKSGLNLTMAEDTEAFLHKMHPSAPLAPMLRSFGPEDVQDFSRALGQQVFTGSSGRVFPLSMKASPLLRAWLLGAACLVAWRRSSVVVCSPWSRVTMMISCGSACTFFSASSSSAIGLTRISSAQSLKRKMR